MKLWKKVILTAYLAMPIIFLTPIDTTEDYQRKTTIVFATQPAQISQLPEKIFESKEVSEIELVAEYEEPEITTEETPEPLIFDTIIADEVVVEVVPFEPEERPHLTKQSGVFAGPSGKETYYNLNMSRCIDIMRSMGYDEETYSYWIRDDGAKMLGEYVMCAASLDIRPKGTIIETSLGQAIVVDTGTFAYSNQTQIDICVNW